MPDYAIVSQVERNELNEDTGTVVAGRRVTFKDLQHGVVASIFVPRDVYTTENVDLLIRNELATLRGVHTLGS